MGMLEVLTTTVASNAGVSFENIILIVFLLGGGIFYAKSFQIGIIMHFIGVGCLFMLFYALGLNYVFSLVIFFIALVLMALSLYASSKTVQYGGII